MRILFPLALAFLLPLMAGAVEKPRVFILTDISSLDAGEREPDDGQSLIRLLLYSDVLDIEGLAATSNLGHGQVVRPALVRMAVEAYGRVQANLLAHSATYPPAAQLQHAIFMGQPVAGPEVRVNDSIGRSKDTEASEALLNAVAKDDPRPLWICAWGGTADLAQALWKLRTTRPTELEPIVAKLRVHAIGDQDATGPWLRDSFPALHYIRREVAYRGLYRGGDDTSLTGSEWVNAHVRQGHGSLGSLYPDYRGGDIWSGRLGKVLGVKEGDTASFLSLIPNGLNVPDRVGLSSWGGRLEGPALRPTDSKAEPGPASDPDPRLASVYRWRRAVQADFQARLDWCVQPYGNANHAPQAVIGGEMRRTIKQGETLALDAGASVDPDGQALHFEWRIDLPESQLAGCHIEDADKAKARLVVPPSSPARKIPVLLIVRDEGIPALEGYARIECIVAP